MLVKGKIRRGKNNGEGKMGRIIIENAVKRKLDYLYYIDGKGNICEAMMSKKSDHSDSKAGEVIVKNAVKRKLGFLYYIDGSGNICEAMMSKNVKDVENKIEIDNSNDLKLKFSEKINKITWNPLKKEFDEKELKYLKKDFEDNREGDNLVFEDVKNIYLVESNKGIPLTFLTLHYDKAMYTPEKFRGIIITPHFKSLYYKDFFVVLNDGKIYFFSYEDHCDAINNAIKEQVNEIERIINKKDKIK